MRRRHAPLAAQPPHDASHPATPVDSLQRGLEILRCFRAGEDVLPATEIARRLGLPGATVRRLLDTLADQDFLVRADDGQGYGLHVGCFALGQAVLGGSALVRAARAPLQALADRFSVHAFVALGDRDALLVVAHMAGVAAPPWTLGTGMRLSVADTAAGWAWLWAQAPLVQGPWLAGLREDAASATRAGVWRAFHDLETRGLCVAAWPGRHGTDLLAAPWVMEDGSVAVLACASNAPAAQPALAVALRETLQALRATRPGMGRGTAAPDAGRSLT